MDLQVVGVFNDSTGYGRLAEEVSTSLHREGWHISKVDVESSLLSLSRDIPTIIVQPPWVHHPRDLQVYWFTMIESTGMGDIDLLNQSKGVIVPNTFSSAVLLSRGLDVPVKQCPLWADSHPPVINPYYGKTRFGYALRVYDGGVRKNYKLLIDSFQKAFPDRSDVLLSIKVDANASVPYPQDRRIELIKAEWTPVQMDSWLSSLDVFVSPSHGEGWGFSIVDALSRNIPVIAAPVEGVQEYFNVLGGWPIEFDWSRVDIRSTIDYGGFWPAPREDSLIQALQEATDVKVRLFKTPSVCVRTFTRERFGKTLSKILCELIWKNP